jgi:hypothetical protein
MLLVWASSLSSLLRVKLCFNNILGLQDFFLSFWPRSPFEYQEIEDAENTLLFLQNATS